MTDHEAMLAIQDPMDGAEWNSDTLEAVAEIMVEAGYQIRDMNTSAVISIWWLTVFCRAADLITASMPTRQPPRLCAGAFSLGSPIWPTTTHISRARSMSAQSTT